MLQRLGVIEEEHQIQRRGADEYVHSLLADPATHERLRTRRPIRADHLRNRAVEPAQ